MCAMFLQGKCQNGSQCNEGAHISPGSLRWAQNLVGGSASRETSAGSRTKGKKGKGKGKKGKNFGKDGKGKNNAPSEPVHPEPKTKAKAKAKATPGKKMEQMSKKELIAMNKNTMSALAAHTICPHWKKGTCNKGAGCSMIHGDDAMKEEMERAKKAAKASRKDKRNGSASPAPKKKNE